MHGQTITGAAIGVIGLVTGVIIGTSVIGGIDVDGGGGISGFSIGMPEFLIIGTILLFIGFWVAAIGAAVWGVGRLTRRHYPGRMEDLPADFDDWHRRAHERMRERGDDSDRRG
jgi:hypothetical protein